MYRSQTLALKYFSAAITFFGVMTISGLITAYYYITPISYLEFCRSA
jgi:nitric oxide reductase large subunit